MTDAADVGIVVGAVRTAFVVVVVDFGENAGRRLGFGRGSASCAAAAAAVGCAGTGIVVAVVVAVHHARPGRRRLPQTAAHLVAAVGLAATVAPAASVAAAVVAVAAAAAAVAAAWSLRVDLRGARLPLPSAAVDPWRRPLV